MMPNDDETRDLMRRIIDTQTNVLDQLRILHSSNIERDEKLDLIIRQVHEVSESLHELHKWQLETNLRLERHGKRIDLVEHHLQLVSTSPTMIGVPDFIVDPRQVTDKNHRVDAVAALKAEIEADREAELKERQAAALRADDKKLWWKRQWAIWLMASVGWLLAGLITGCAYYAASHIALH